MTKILITGSTGFIGGHLAEKLAKKYDVKCLVRKSSDTRFIGNLDVEIQIGDITKKYTLKKITNDIDVVFHLAALMRKWNLPDKTYWDINFKGTKNILEMSLKDNVKQFIQCSTTSVIGPVKDVPLNESCPYYDTRNIYNKTKAEAEKFVLSKKNLIPITIVSLDLVFGPRNFNYLPIFKAVKSKKIQIIGDGKNFHHPTFVDDVVQGFELVLNNRKTFGEKFIVASKPMTSTEIIYTIARELDVKIHPFHAPLELAKLGQNIFEILGRTFKFEPILREAIIDFFTINHIYDISKAKKVLGFKPKVSFREGARKTIEWYNENGYL